MNGTENILDIGCGDGRITAQIASKVPDGGVLGIDNSENMIKLARDSFPESEYQNLKFKIMDAQKMNFCEEFDIVFSNAALHWVKNHSPVLRGVKKALKVTGRVILQMGGKGNAQDIIDVLLDLIAGDKWKKYFEVMEFPYGFFDEDEYIELLTSAGLNPVRVSLIPKKMTHSNIEELEGWIRTTWLPYTQKVPGELQEEFIHEIAVKYIEMNPSNSQVIELNMVRLEVEAERVD